MTDADIRVNARLTGTDAAHFQELLAQSGASASEVLRAALRSYHASNVVPKTSPKQLLQGFVAAADGPEDLALEYKRYLGDALGTKLAMANRKQSASEQSASYTLHENRPPYQSAEPRSGKPA